MTTPAPLPLPAPQPDLRWSGLTDRGKVRPNNEDSFLALAFDGREVRRLGKIGNASSATSDFVFAVSDGMGGAKSGEFASRITVEKITQLLPKSFKLSASTIEQRDVLARLHTQNLHMAGSCRGQLDGSACI